MTMREGLTGNQACCQAVLRGKFLTCSAKRTSPASSSRPISRNRRADTADRRRKHSWMPSSLYRQWLDGRVALHHAPGRMDVRVKICGLTRPDDVVATVAAGADAIGFVFAPGSKRLVTPRAAAALARLVPPFIARVGLFVDAPADLVSAAQHECRLDTLQFHGDESPEYCAQFAANARVLKAIRVRDLDSTLATAHRYAVDALLLDAFVPGQHGGTGARFDWSLAKAVVDRGHTVILAGGLDPSNVADAILAVRPFAVDVSSGVESGPGIKDAAKVRAFVQAARMAG